MSWSPNVKEAEFVYDLIRSPNDEEVEFVEEVITIRNDKDSEFAGQISKQQGGWNYRICSQKFGK